MIDIKEVRNELDAFDSELVETLAKRLKITDKVIQFKRENPDTYIFQKAREEEIFDERSKQLKDLGFDDPELIHSIFAAIIKSSTNMQVAALGEDRLKPKDSV